MLASAFLAVPAQASASMASIFAAPSVCGAGTGPFAADGTDGITVSSAWQKGSPAGQVDIPLAGTGVAWEWKIDCLAPGGGTSGSGTSGVASVIGDGVHTFTHRAQDGGGVWTDWVDETVRIDSGSPVNSTSAASAWRQGPVTVPLDVADSLSPVHGEWKVDGDSGWTMGTTATVDGTAVHTLYTAAVDAAGNRDEKTHTIQIDNADPVDNTTVPAGWQHNSADITITGVDGHSGVASVRYKIDGGPEIPAVNGDTITISTHGTHTIDTKIIDVVGNESDWKSQIVEVDAAGPSDTTTVPAGWITSPSYDVNVSGTDTGGSGVTRIEWDLDNGTATGDVLGAGPVVVHVSGDGDHVLKTRLTDGMGDTSGWTTRHVKIDTVNPTDTTTAATGWLSVPYLDVTVAGTDAHSGVQRVEWELDGVPGSFVGGSRVVRVSGNGEHTLTTRIVDVAGLDSGWTSHTIKLDTTAPVNQTAAASSAWRTTPYSVKVGGTDTPSGVRHVRWRVDNGTWKVGTNGDETATVTGEGVHTLETEVVDLATPANMSGARAETIRIDSVKPTDTTACPASAVGNGHKITITATDANSQPSGNVKWTLDGGAEKTATSVTLSGGGAHTLKTRVEDNAGNWSDWKTCVATVNLALPSEDTDTPVDTTFVPTEWQTGPTTVVVSAEDATTPEDVKVQWRLDGQPAKTGASGSSFEVATDGAHKIETRAYDKLNHFSQWREQTLKIDSVVPQDTTAVTAGWVKSRTIVLSGTDATSGIDVIEYQVDGGPTQSVANGGSVTMPGDGTYTLSHRAIDRAGHATEWVDDTFDIDSVAPVLTSAPAPTGWQVTPISLTLTGTDDRSGVDHYEWRVDSGEIQTGSAVEVETEGAQLLETRVVDKAGNESGWRQENIRVDTTKPQNTTPAPSTTWRKTNYTTTVTGTDATPGSGVAAVEYRIDGGSTVQGSAVSLTTAGLHKLETRVRDAAGNDSGWRADWIGIDKTAPTLTANCGTAGWRNTPAVCSVSADGGESGLDALTAARGTGAPEPITGGTYSVDGDGTHTLIFRAVDRAGNETLSSASVKIDRTPPTASVTCTPGAGLTYVCSGSGADGGSGLQSVTYSVDGATAALGGDGTFAVLKGTVVVTATDNAGNVGASAPLPLADRTPPPPPAPPVSKPTPPEETVTPRTTSEAVLLRRRGSAAARLLGQLAISSTPSGTTVDLRPLALGSGRFRFVIKVTTGRKTKTVTKSLTTKKGYSPRIIVKAAAAASTTVSLSVSRRSGRRWVAYAGSSAKL